MKTTIEPSAELAAQMGASRFMRFSLKWQQASMRGRVYTPEQFELEETYKEIVEDLERRSLPGKVESPATEFEAIDPRHPAKGDFSLLRGQETVNYLVSERYVGIGRRRLQQAIREGKLTVCGRGKQKRVTVESLLNYQPSLKKT